MDSRKDYKKAAHKILMTLVTIVFVHVYLPFLGIRTILSKISPKFKNEIELDENKVCQRVVLWFAGYNAIIYLPIFVLLKFFGRFFNKSFLTIKRQQNHNYLTSYFINAWYGEGYDAQNNRTFVGFLLPSLGAFLLFVMFPFVHGIYLSFTNWTGLNTGREIFIGLENYKGIIKDYAFLYSFYRTVLYSLFNIFAINIVAFLLALLVTSNLKFQNAYRAAFFVPNLIGGLVLGYLWQFIFNEALINIINPSLISRGTTSLYGLIIVVTWQYAGYIMMIYIAALQNVPQDLIEASKIDGATSVQRLKHIIWPLIAQAFTIAMFLTLVTSFKQFDTIVSLANPSTNLPGWISNLYNVGERRVSSLNLVAVNIYKEAYENYNMGLGQAKAILFFLALLVVSLVQVYFNKKKEIEL